MFLIIILLLAAAVSLAFTPTGLLGKALSACGTLLCYLGVIIFITLSFTRALRSGAKH
jgi:hypothetical protein